MRVKRDKILQKVPAGSRNALLKKHQSLEIQTIAGGPLILRFFFLRCKKLMDQLERLLYQNETKILFIFLFQGDVCLLIYLTVLLQEIFL